MAQIRSVAHILSKNQRCQMISDRDYVEHSLETHLFFLRIMKEHTIFLQAGLPPVNAKLTKDCSLLIEKFENYLRYAVQISKGYVKPEFLASGQIVTPYTLDAEKITQTLSGIPIDTSITKSELELQAITVTNARHENLTRDVKLLNAKLLSEVTALIDFKTTYLEEQSKCRIFSWIYPSMIEHMIHEAQLYHSTLEQIESKQPLDSSGVYVLENHWNDFMKEHGEYTNGLLDPTELDLKKAVKKYIEAYSAILEMQESLNPTDLKFITEKSNDVTKKYQSFNETSAKALVSCEVSSIIVPLLGDHLLRESSHYAYFLAELLEKQTVTSE